MADAEPKVGTLRITSATDYGRADGFAVEQFTYANTPEPIWCIPGWVEDAWGETGFFATEAEASSFIEMVNG